MCSPDVNSNMRSRNEHPSASFFEQVAVRSGASQRQEQDFILDTVDQKPIRQNMTLAVSEPISSQRMVSVFVWERLSHCED